MGQARSRSQRLPKGGQHVRATARAKQDTTRASFQVSSGLQHRSWRSAVPSQEDGQLAGANAWKCGQELAKEQPPNIEQTRATWASKSGQPA